MAEDIKKILEKHRNEIRSEISALKTDVKRHFDVVAEHLEDKISTLKQKVNVEEFALLERRVSALEGRAMRR